MAVKSQVPVQKQGRWYFGGLSSAAAATCTHPLDLLKVHLITQQQKQLGLTGMFLRVVRNDGFLALYNGISASILRQLTYSTTRFGVYESVKNFRENSNVKPSFVEKAFVAAGAGFMGGIVGNPGDMVNVRMQNDMKIPREQRRNYKHAIDGLIKVWRYEGVSALMNGVTMTATRAAFMTMGQLAFYDTFKGLLLKSSFFSDNPVTHMTASVGAAGVATLLTQPFDVMKTRLMNAKPGTYNSLFSCIVDIFKNGPLGFFKGLVPAFVRLGPQTVLTFVFLEQMKSWFGRVPPNVPVSTTAAS